MIRRAFAALVALAAMSNTCSAGTIRLTLAIDQIVSLPPSTATVVIGNPLIADLTVVPQNRAVLTAKSYGATNIIVLDRRGNILEEHTIEVRRPDNLIVLHCAAPRQTFVCGPNCEPRKLLGDESCPSGSTGGSSSGGGSGTSANGASASNPAAGGPCDNPDDRASDGTRCGGRAASERPGGRS